jgi:hypothetical protein
VRISTPPLYQLGEEHDALRDAVRTLAEKEIQSHAVDVDARERYLQVRDAQRENFQVLLTVSRSARYIKSVSVIDLVTLPQVPGRVIGMTVSTREAGAAFADVVYADQQWVDAEFEALISASFSEPPAPPPPAPPRVPPRPGTPPPPSRARPGRHRLPDHRAGPCPAALAPAHLPGRPACRRPCP